MHNLKKFLPFIFILVLSYWSIRPLFISGFFPIHDDTQVARVFEMKKALRDGMFPVRWVPDLGYGYGYPIFNFYAPLAYYIGGVFNLVGFDSLLATKFMMGLGIILAGVCMYLFAKEFWGDGGGLVAGLLYLYAPYHAVDIYVRGDVAESWAYALIPLVFFCLYKVFLSTNNTMWRWVSMAAVVYASLILSHNLTAMMVTPFLFIIAGILYFALRRSAKGNQHYFILLSLVLGILIASFYWLPTLTEMQFTNVLSQIGGGADYKDHFVCLPQLWSSPWGFGGSTSSCVDGLSFKIGKMHLVLALFSVVSLVFFWRKNKTKFSLIVFSLLSFFFSVFLMLNQSQFIWDAIPHMAFFQYPWRFLLIVTFFVSFLGGASGWIMKIIFKNLPHENFVLGGLISILLVSIVYFNADIFVPQTILKKTAQDYVSKESLQWSTSKISDEYLPKGFYKPKNFNEVPGTKLAGNDKKIVVLTLQEKTQQIHAEVLAEKQQEILVHHAYFPAWHVFIDNKQVWFNHFNKGLLVTIPQGRHTLDIRFIQTPIEKLGNVLSLTGVFVLILGIIYARKQMYEHKKT